MNNARIKTTWTVCSRGHSFVKSTDVPVCPVCWPGRYEKPSAAIDGYMSRFPDDVRNILRMVRDTIRAAAPNATEAMKYGMPTFRLNRKNLIHFAAWKSHIGVYPTPSGLTAFETKLAEYKTSKGAAQFPLHAPLPLSLIREIVRYRVRECTG